MIKIKNLEKTAERILKAIKNKEKIILYGDCDLDGAVSVIILRESIKTLGGEVTDIYFPNRLKEGYGITMHALDKLKKHAPALLISVDCGIGNVKEVKRAKELGFDVIIVDHHKVLDDVPEADIIVDPKQSGDMSPFKEYAAAGVVFKLSQELLKDKMSASLKQNFLEITALASIADMVPQVDENKVFIERGLDTLEESWRPGIKIFFEKDFLTEQENFREKVGKMISILNIQVTKNNAPACFTVLTLTDEEELEPLIRELKKKHENKDKNIAELVEKIEEKEDGNDEPIIFQGGKDYDYMLIPGSASILSQTFEKPTFLYYQMEDESIGTVRSTDEIDSVDLMKKCKDLLITFGGHPKASGFRIKNENIEEFKKRLIENL
jgi:single-stranded-DNA-specific exonuclease